MVVISEHIRVFLEHEWVHITLTTDDLVSNHSLLEGFHVWFMLICFSSLGLFVKYFVAISFVSIKYFFSFWKLLVIYRSLRIRIALFLNLVYIHSFFNKRFLMLCKDWPRCLLSLKFFKLYITAKRSRHYFLNLVKICVRLSFLFRFVYFHLFFFNLKCRLTGRFFALHRNLDMLRDVKHIRLALRQRNWRDQVQLSNLLASDTLSQFRGFFEQLCGEAPSLLTEHWRCKFSCIC